MNRYNIIDKVVNKSGKTIDELVAIYLRIKEFFNFKDSATDKQWTIMDVDPNANLYLVHYIMKNFDRMNSNIGNIRGIILHITDDNIIQIGRSQGYVHEIKSINDNNKLSYGNLLTDNNNVIFQDTIVPNLPPNQAYATNTSTIKNKKITYAFQRKNIEMRMGFEGTIIRVFYFNSKMYISTHRLIDAENVTINKGKYTYGQLYKILNGPSAEDLFDTTKKYSPYCHVFLISHIDLLNVTKMNIDDSGFLVYMGAKRMYDASDIKNSFNPNDVSLIKKNINVLEDLNEIIDHLSEGKSFVDSNGKHIVLSNPVIVGKKSFDEIATYKDTYIVKEKVDENLVRQYLYDSNEMLNKLLTTGFSKPRDVTNELLQYGEFINIYVYNDSGVLMNIYKYVSNSYEWRNFTRESKYSFYERAIYLITDSKSSYINNDLYKKAYPAMKKLNKLDININLNDKEKIKQVDSWGLKSETYNNLSIEKSKFYNTWQCLIYTLPHSHISEGYNIFKYYEEDINNLVYYLHDSRNYNKGISEMFPQVYSLMEEIKPISNNEKKIRAALQNLEGSNLLKLIDYYNNYLQKYEEFQ